MRPLGTNKPVIERITPISTPTRIEQQNEGENEGSCVKFGQARDEKIVQLIRSGTAFTRKQIEQIIFANIKSSMRVSQFALSRLFEQERVKKWVRSRQLPTIYYHRKPKQLDHVLLINEVYCELLRQRKPNYIIEWKWRYEILGGIVIADAMITIFTEPNRKGKRVIFLEVELHPGKRFDKPVNYKKVFDADWIREEWSVMRNNTAVFPAILVITDDKLVIKSELNFIVASLEQVQKDVYSLILGR